MAMGQMDFSIAGGSKPWDHVAGQLILNEIGGVSCRSDRLPYDPSVDGYLISASTPKALDLAMEHLVPQQWS
jgi:fructose-1,6-bisphosphatase/inositol monophosphatase family enzyme